MITYQINRKDGALVTSHEVKETSIHQADDGSWVAWAEMTNRSIDGRQLPVTGGIHVSRGSKAALLHTLRSGRL